MSPHYFEFAVIVIGVAVLFLLSLVEGALIAASPVTLRKLQEREGAKASPVLDLILDNKSHLFLPLHLGIQIVLLTVAILTTHLALVRLSGFGLAWPLLLMILASILFRQLFPRLLTQNGPEEKLLTLLRYLGPLVTACRVFAAPVTGIIRASARFYVEPDTPASSSSEEKAEEEIQAYLEIGRTEGILETEDTQLIQSVVEFGDTLVRAVMTPRTAIDACGETATVGELRDIMVNCRHSRIPIYRGDLDHVVGIAYIRHLLAQCGQGREGDSISGLIHPALFVPETKRVSALLRELQIRGDHAAIVIDEFGGVAGLVTIEDLIEEIVGEIRDEDQAKVSEFVQEGPQSYTMRGSTELHHLEELTGRKFAGHDASTAAGLVASYLGRIPAPGEEFELEGIRVQILDADRKRIRRLRVHLREPRP
jgi:CBS domain containing-hemolysin-like protein